MPKPMRRLLCKLGQRGSALLNVGAIWTMIGIVGGLNPPEQSHDEEVGLLHYAIPHWWAFWLAAGLIAVVAATWKRPKRDVWGFIALFVPPFVQAFSYGYSFVVWLASSGDLGYSQGIILAVGWGFIALLPYTLAGWAEPADRNGGVT